MYIPGTGMNNKDLGHTGTNDPSTFFEELEVPIARNATGVL